MGPRSDFSVRKLRWGLLACGDIAGAFVKGVRGSDSGEIHAVASRSHDKAQAFAEKHAVCQAYGSYEELLQDPGVDAVYISTPHPMHLEWIIRAAEAGKHILCEKPLTLNEPEAMLAFDAAQRHDVLLMEAFMYRCHPLTGKLCQLVRDAAIGQITLIRATFSFRASYNPESRLFNSALGGGGILDVGCYTASMARLIAGAVRGIPFGYPTVAHASGELMDTGVDGWAMAVLKFEGGLTAQLSAGVNLAQDSGIDIYGSEGRIHVPDCWVPAVDGGDSSIYLVMNDGKREEIVVPASKPLYSYEVDAFAAALAKGERDVPQMSSEDSLGNMQVLDSWRHMVGVQYEREKGSDAFPSFSGRPLRPGHKGVMPLGRIPGLDRDISRLVMGAGIHLPMVKMAALYDDFIERGGNAFDTAWIYENGQHQRKMGHWLRSRGLHKEVFIIVKGGHLHSGDCRPEKLERQLNESLERMQMDVADLYLVHCDDPHIPAGEFMDALNRLVVKGKTRTIGVSNWTLPRIEEAEKHIHAHGLAELSAVSNQLSLARMARPMWEGSVSSSGRDSRSWLERRQLPMFAWASQSSGYFTWRGARNFFGDTKRINAWVSDENVALKRRAYELAQEKGVKTHQIALAFVLGQPFPTYALIGPQSIQETRLSCPALDIRLSPEEIQWLAMDGVVERFKQSCKEAIRSLTKGADA